LDDLTIVDWNAALIVDREGDDIRAVLEFANVELLEMRYLDQKIGPGAGPSLRGALKTIVESTANRRIL
jgi:hypothetical protein